MTSSPRRAHGYLLIEVLVVIALLVFFMVLAAQLFSGTMKVVREAPAAEAALARLDAVVARLRADVWRASALSVPDSNTVKISLPDGQTVTWQRSDPADLSRVVTGPEKGAAPLAWRGLRYRLSFAPAGAAVIVHVALMPDPWYPAVHHPDSVTPPAPEAQFVLVSQPLLARREAP